MITVSINSLIALIALFSLSGLLIIWLFDEWKRRKSKVIPNKIITISCDICMTQINCDRDEKFVRCTACNSLIKINK